MNQLLKKIWYRFTDRSARVPPIRILVLAAGLIVVSWLITNWLWQTFVAAGMVCLGIGFYCWYLQWRFKRRQRQQEKPLPVKTIQL